MENKFIVSSSPHIRSNEDTSYIMKQVLLALSPAALAALYYFRASALFVMFLYIRYSLIRIFISKIMKQKKKHYRGLFSSSNRLLLDLMCQHHFHGGCVYWVVYLQ